MAYYRDVWTRRDVVLSRVAGIEWIHWGVSDYRRKLRIAFAIRGDRIGWNRDRRGVPAFDVSAGDARPGDTQSGRTGSVWPRSACLRAAGRSGRRPRNLSRAAPGCIGR